MDRDANYVAVGAFVLLVLVMAAGFVIWYTETGDRRVYQRYEIYFEGSVFGLSEGGSVRYLGVAVGRVARIGLDPRKAGRVLVLADIAEGTPIEADTGLLFIDLRPADPGKQRIRPDGAGGHPVIASERSDFDVFVSSLPDVVARAGEALNRVNAALSDQNITRVSSTLASVELASRDLPETIAGVRATLAELQAAAAEIEAAAAGIREVATSGGGEIRAAATRLREVADNVARTTARLDRFVAENAGHFDRFAAHGLPEFERLLREARDAVRAFESLSSSLEQDPSRLIYEPPARGVEIPP
jgi:phospholipid/cholesterol/gamma-HCH transport system substrate-binding protein